MPLARAAALMGELATLGLVVESGTLLVDMAENGGGEFGNRNISPPRMSRQHATPVLFWAGRKGCKLRWWDLTAVWLLDRNWRKPVSRGGAGVWDLWVWVPGCWGGLATSNRAHATCSTPKTRLLWAKVPALRTANKKRVKKRSWGRRRRGETANGSGQAQRVRIPKGRASTRRRCVGGWLLLGPVPSSRSTV